MTINNIEKYVSTLWDWGIFDGCFGDTKIRVTDIDGAVERNGNFLFIETKSPGVQISVGQAIFFSNLVRMGASVLIIWGDKGDPKEVLFQSPRGTKKYSVNILQLRDIMKDWFKWANSHKN